MIAGAGAACLNGAFGVWEFVFCAIVMFFAFRGLQSYTAIGIGWLLLHTGWDVSHHLYGTPIVPFVATSSLGCAICDPVIAAWCFVGAPSLWNRRADVCGEGVSLIPVALCVALLLVRGGAAGRFVEIGRA